jgi:glutathione S-transferase
MESHMKLYYSPGACSLSPHIALLEAGANFEAVKVGKDKQAADGRDFRDINPFGYVPALELDDGAVLLEGPAIVQYIADRFPEAKLAPPNGTLERYRLQSALGFVNSEIHKTASGLFQPGLSDQERNQIVDRLDARFQQLAVWRNGKDWIANEDYSVADVYLLVVTRWLQ